MSEESSLSVVFSVPISSANRCLFSYVDPDLPTSEGPTEPSLEPAITVKEYCMRKALNNEVPKSGRCRGIPDFFGRRGGSANAESANLTANSVGALYDSLRVCGSGRRRSGVLLGQPTGRSLPVFVFWRSRRDLRRRSLSGRENGVMTTELNGQNRSPPQPGLHGVSLL